MAELLSSPAFWGSLATLTFLEIVLGIDNLLFVSIATGNLQGRQKKQATRVGVWGAMVLRIGMLGLIFWILQLDKSALFHLPHGVAVAFAGGSDEVAHHIEEVTLKDLILFAGGLFLLWKGTQEIHASVEGTHHEESSAKSGFMAVVLQLIVINIVFSLDSVITAGVAGYFRAEVALLETVTTGQRLGAVYDLFGQETQAVYADQDGIVIMLRRVHRVHVGDGLAHITNTLPTSEG